MSIKLKNVLRCYHLHFDLQANLPLLQQELLQCSQMAKQSPHQYLSQNEPMLHDRERLLHLEAEEFIGDRVGDKRKLEHER